MAGLTASQQAFVDKVMPYAIEASKQTGIDPRIIVAQAAQESAWGTAAPGNNYFGIKALPGQSGQNLATTEYYGGKKVGENASFRTFDSAQDSFNGYARLMNNKFYEGVRTAQGLDAQATALGKSGYATDPNYGTAVGNIARNIQAPQPANVSGAMYQPNQAIPASFSLAERASAIPTQGFRPNSSLTMSPTNVAPLSMVPQTQAPQAQQSNDYDPLASGTYPQTFPPQTPQGDPNDYDPLASGTYPRTFPAQAAPAPLVADNLTDDPSYKGTPLHQYAQFEPNSIPAGPYGSEKLAQALVSGDQAAISAAGNAIYANVVAKYGDPNLLNMGSLLAAQREVTDYFTKTLPTQAPGAVRQVQTLLAQNPQMASMVPKDQQANFQKAFGALPQQTYSSTPMPNMRPEGLNYPEPLVAQAPQTDPLAPKMASFTTSSPAPQVMPYSDPYAYDPLASGTYPQTEMPQQSHPWTQHQAQPQQTQPEYDPFATADVSTYQQAPQQPPSFIDPNDYDPLASGTYPQSQPGHPWVTPQQQQLQQQPSLPSHPWITPQQSAQVQPYAQPAMPSHPWTNPIGVVPGLPIPQAGMTPQSHPWVQPQQQQQQPQMQAPQTFATQVAPQIKSAEQQLAEYYDKPTDDQGNFAPTSWSGGWGYSDDTQFLPDLDAMNGNRGWA